MSAVVLMVSAGLVVVVALQARLSDLRRRNDNQREIIEKWSRTMSECPRCGKGAGR